jgi:colanic acid/amylovoran biosynthesis protein
VSQRSEISIGLLWHSAGAGNLGVGALTVGNIASVRIAAEAAGLTPKFTILHFPSDMAQDYVIGEDIKVVQINRKLLLSPTGFWAEVGALDCVLDIGAGDSFADIYGYVRFIFMWLSKEIVHLRGIPLLMSPQTIGPFTRQPYKFLAAHAMRRAFAVVARDPESFSALRALSPRARAVQAVDVAFRLPFTPAARTSKLLNIGVNVSGLLFNGGYGGSNEYGMEVDYAGLMRRFISEQVARADVRVHLLTHVVSERLPVDDDSRVADLLKQEFPDVIRVPDFTSPSAAKSYIAGLDFLVSGRMHACIAAYSSGVPVVPVAYSRKFSGLFGGVLKYPYQIPVTGLATDDALEMLNRCVNDRATLEEAIRTGAKVVAPALAAYDAVLLELFQKVKTRKAA